MREWPSLWYFPQVKVVTGLSCGAVSSCVTFSPLPTASGSLQRERDPSSLPVSRWTCLQRLLPRCS